MSTFQQLRETASVLARWQCVFVVARLTLNELREPKTLEMFLNPAAKPVLLQQGWKHENQAKSHLRGFCTMTAVMWGREPRPCPRLQAIDCSRHKQHWIRSSTGWGFNTLIGLLIKAPGAKARPANFGSTPSAFGMHGMANIEYSVKY